MEIGSCKYEDLKNQPVDMKKKIYEALLYSLQIFQ